MKRGWAGHAAAWFVAMVLAGCGGGGSSDAGGGGGGFAANSGTLRVAVTDTPACGFDEVNVTIERVRLHATAAAADADAGWVDFVVTPPRRIDLTNLTNGVLDELGQTTVPAGRYTQLRVVLAENSAARPLANSVRPTGAGEVPLDTPSAAQSGLKVNADIDVPVGGRADVVVDFDACRSVVRRGNSGQYNLHPVLRVVQRLSDAGHRVVGYVGTALVSAATNVSLQLAGVPVKSTVPDASGRFALYPVPAGTYDLVVVAPGRATAVVTGVPVTATAPTNVNTAAAPIQSRAALARTVAGSVTPPTATLRALQTLSGGPSVEVAWAGVDATSGAFTLALPLETLRAPFVASAAAPAFVPDAAVAGRYTLEARSGGSVKTIAIDAATIATPVVITFP